MIDVGIHRTGAAPRRTAFPPRSSARAFLSNNKYATLLSIVLLAFVTLYFIPHILVCVGPGERAVMFYPFGGGTDLSVVYGEGMHLKYPWNSLTTYDVRIQERHRDIDLLDRTGLPIRVEVSVRFHPEHSELPRLHAILGPDYVDTALMPLTVSAMQDLAGRRAASELATEGCSIAQELITIYRRLSSDYHVHIDGITLSNIRLPANMQKAIEYRAEQSELALAYDHRIAQEKKEAIRRQIEADAVSAYNSTVKTTLSDDVLKWSSIEAMKHIATAPGGKLMLIGRDINHLPFIIDTNNDNK